MGVHPPSRLDAARRRLAEVKRALAVASVAGFGLAALWAHASHPGTAAVVRSGNAPVSAEDDDQGGGFDFGTGSLAPSTAVVPDTATHVS